MSVNGGVGLPVPITSVAVAVNGGAGSRSRGSRRAFIWAFDNLFSQAQRLVLVHVMPRIASIPTPSGKCIPIGELDANVVAMYVQEKRQKFEEIFIPFKNLKKSIKIETLLLEDDNVAVGLLRHISESGIKNLVLGSCCSNVVVRKVKGPGVPSIVLKYAPETCNVYVVSRQRIVTKWSTSTSTIEASPRQLIDPQGKERLNSYTDNKQSSGFSSPVESSFHRKDGPISLSETSYSFSQACTIIDLGSDGQTPGESNRESLRLTRCSAVTSTTTDQSDWQAEVEQLRLELKNTVAMYNRACSDLVHAQTKVQIVSSECLEEARKVNSALEREEQLRKIASEEKAKQLEIMKEIELARNLLVKEACERQIAEMNALKESAERQKVVEALLVSDKRYRRYCINEIEVATDYFSESKVIGEGGYGKVYKCSLDHITVAVKALRSDARDKKEEFLREVEILGELRHPNIVLLLGACPESGCLVYEYMENGSLEDCIFHRNSRPTLPWFTRFRIIYEIACGLAFLHSSKPEPIVHRDLKPGNILLDRNYVGKIGDVGLAKLVSDIVPDNVTEYRDSIIAGTLYYLDPEYQRTGTVRPKSDLYAFGVIVLQLLVSRHPKGLLLAIENAVSNGSLVNLLDMSVKDWPLIETVKLAEIALKCCRLRCRDRPDLETEVLPDLRKLADFADASMKMEKSNVFAPSHYFCPILQEVMDDPHIAADGFTYEYRAIKAWLEKHKVSPVTRARFQSTVLTPNHSLRSAIQEWRSRLTFLAV